MKIFTMPIGFFKSSAKIVIITTTKTITKTSMSVFLERCSM